MGASAAVPRPFSGRGTGLGLFIVLLASLCQPGHAQNYTALRNGVVMPPLCPSDGTDPPEVLKDLAQKLPQIKPGSRAEQQLQLMSVNSRSKMNNLTGSAAEWLQNRTDVELEELFETVRTENFRRMMALSAITTQLRKAFTSINVLRSLELLQTEDLERLASMPLFEERYQRLTNVTFLELIQQLYDYGLTQVPQRTCLLTAANSSSLSRLPNPDPTFNTSISPSSFSAFNPAPNPVTFMTVLKGQTYGHRRSSHRRSSSRRHARRSLLEVFSNAADSWMHVDPEEATAAVVRAVTQGSTRRMLLQTTDPSQAQTQPDKTLAPIVARYIDSLTNTTAPDGSATFHSPTSQNPEQDPAQDPSLRLIRASGGVPALSTQPGLFDSRAVRSGCTETLGLVRYRGGSTASGGTAASSTVQPRTGSSAGSTTPISSRNSTNSSSPVNATVVESGQQLQLPVNCTDNTVFNGTDCVPCPAGSVLEGGACVCANGTVWQASLAACLPVASISTNTTDVNSLPAPCVNGTLGNGTTGNGSLCGATGSPIVEAPTVLNASYVDTPIFANGTLAPADANVTVTDGGNALNASDAVASNSSVLAPFTGVIDATDPLGVPGNASLSVPIIGSLEVPPLGPVQPPEGLLNGTTPPPVPLTPTEPGGPITANNTEPSTPGVPPVAPPTLEAPLPVVPPAPVLEVPLLTNQTTDTVPAVPPTPAPEPAPVPAPVPSPIDANAVAQQPAVTAPGVLPVADTVPPTEAIQQPAVQPLPPVVTPTVPEVVTPTVTPVVPEVVTPVVPEVVTPVTPPVVAVAAPPPVACVGQWIDSGACNAPCESTGTQSSVFQILVAAADGGAPCEAAAGAVRQVPCSNPTPCPKPPDSCVGAWAETGTCNAPCEGTGTKTSMFTVATPAANGGAPCEAASGATREVPCSNPTPCPKPPVNCIGSWAETGTCNAPCEATGTKASVYTLTTPAANGGAPCEAASGATREVPCSNPTPCPKPPVNCIGSWAETGTCNAPCEATGTKTSVYTVSTPAANGGAACEAASGATKQVPCSNPDPCPKTVAPVAVQPVVQPVVEPVIAPVTAPVPKEPAAQPAVANVEVVKP